ncbi:hypothetical protein [Amycolatopsis magusensis]|uniref:hypothetical protein n=1 Tax=Amycolatopsis magusensis TaxID=882444 RepID=UPI0024A987B1|nr:hypothetical protein [Amycolatopsis magusensis]MDI5978540.1 hypothetical protein [Amycolatopsis magusensis]
MTVPSTRGLARLLPQPPRVPTPLGAVRFSGVLGSWHIAPRPATAFRLPSGGTLSRWTHRAVTLDLLTGPLPTPGSPWGAVWYVVAHRGLEVVDLTLDLPGATGSLDSSTLTVTEAGTQVTLAGPAPDALAAYAREGTHLPARWATAPGTVTQTAAGALTWRLPALLPGEHARIGTAVAWNSASAEDAAWFAAAVPLETSLAALVGH